MVNQEPKLKVTITLPQYIDAKLQELMKLEDRSKSYLISNILKDFFKETDERKN
tara:strand:- start:2137 stop:2298 length:162 start_codon:yes stop_codon:yes gene_type:complete